MLALSIVVCCSPCATCLKFSVIRDCTNPQGRDFGEFAEADYYYAGQEGNGISINVTAKQFYASFASMFRLSDGSKISVPSTEQGQKESLRYMQEILGNVGVYVNTSASEDSPYEGDIFQICGKVPFVCCFVFFIHCDLNLHYTHTQYMCTNNVTHVLTYGLLIRTYSIFTHTHIHTHKHTHTHTHIRKNMCTGRR
jgi:hypothetical protein